ncbi:MAG: hypothetical protein IJQ77_01770 [Synergistaceae bacterium]|nr:hypothetical protein [Synergistaceae bacterium]
MKTLQDLYEEVKASDDLKRALAEAVKAGKVTEFLKAHECDATADELNEFVAEKVKSDKPLRELSEDELEMVAGGDGTSANEMYCSPDRTTVPDSRDCEYSQCTC